MYYFFRGLSSFVLSYQTCPKLSGFWNVLWLNQRSRWARDKGIFFPNKPFGMKICWRWRCLPLTWKGKSSQTGRTIVELLDSKFVLFWKTHVWWLKLYFSEWLCCFCVLAILACLREIAKKITWGRLVSKIDTTWLMAWKKHEFLYTQVQFNSYLSVNEENHIWLRKRSEINYPFPSNKGILNEKLGDHL